MARHRAPSSTRDINATWRSLATHCRELDWSRRRLLDEFQNGLRFRTIPSGHENEINWHDPIVTSSLNVEASEVTYEGVDRLDRRAVRSYTVGIEVPWPPDAPADAEAPLPSADAPALAPAPRRIPLTGKDLRDCILAIKEERPDDPPDRDELREEVENRLNWPVGRDRVEKIRKKVAPQWVNPKGRPRKSAQ
jgi:hypothetical protein